MVKVASFEYRQAIRLAEIEGLTQQAVVKAQGLSLLRNSADRAFLCCSRFRHNLDALWGPLETHTWIDKAAALFGLGANAVRWIGVNDQQQMDIVALEEQIIADRAAGLLPFLVVGTAGTTSTGAVDPLPAIAALCRQYDLWFHVDGAYGAPAAALPDASPDLVGLREADSIALDPHKWLYSPLEAGCALVRNPHHLVETFSHHPTYYNFDGVQEDPPINYYAWGMQNSRSFRALKVWLALRQVGRAGYIEMIGDDIALSRALYQAVDDHPALQAVTQNLSITTFRFVPPDLPADLTGVEPYLNELMRIASVLPAQPPIY